MRRCTLVVIVDVGQFQGVVVAAGDDGAESAEEIEGFEFGVDEGEDAVVRGHSACFLFVRFFSRCRWFMRQNLIGLNEKFLR